MGSSTHVNLFAPAGHVTPRRLGAVLEALLSAGFVHESGEEGPSPQSFTPDVPAWHVNLVKTPVPGTNWGYGVTMGVSRQDLDEKGTPIPSPIEEIALYASIHESSASRPTYGREVMAWMALLAAIVSPLYGAAGAESGGARYDVYDFPRASLAAREPQPLDWLTVYGPEYVQRMGRDRLLSAPAWRSELLADGSVLLALAPHPDLLCPEDTLRVARHLDVPQRLHWGERFVRQT